MGNDIRLNGSYLLQHARVGGNENEDEKDAASSRGTEAPGAKHQTNPCSNSNTSDSSTPMTPVGAVAVVH